MKEALADFILYLGSEKGASPHTLEAYQRDIRQFLSYLEDEGVTELSVVGDSLIVDYLSSARDKGYASATLCRSLAAVRLFFRFLKREDYIEADPTVHLDTPRLWQLIPEVLSYEEVERLLAQPDSSIGKGARDCAILELLYSSGLRVSEICTLTLYSVGDTFVRVWGKGRKERLVPVGACALEAVDHYLTGERCCYDSENTKALFVNQKGKPITRFYVWRMIKEYAKQGGITKEISPHTLRHSFATHLVQNGADLRVIQEMLGHASVASTDRYTHLSRGDLHTAFAQFHPRLDS